MANTPNYIIRVDILISIILYLLEGLRLAKAIAMINIT